MLNALVRTPGGVDYREVNADRQRRVAALLVAGSLTAAAIAACSTAEHAIHTNGSAKPILASSSTSGAGGAGGMGGAPNQGGSAGGEDLFDAGFNDGSMTSGGISPDAACATGSAEAKLNPVDLFIMFDRSGSMAQNGKWTNTTAALKAFFAAPESGGLRVALRFFADMGCDAPACNLNICSQPLVPLAALTAAPAPADMQELALTTAVNSKFPFGGTPMYAALGGAEQWAKAYAFNHPDDKVAVVLVTDGEPKGCDEDVTHIAALAQDALTNGGVQTYALGLAGSNEAQMNLIASAGGTNAAILIGNGNAEAELLAAFKKIQGDQLACDFPIPTQDGGMAVDPKLINVDFTPSGGMTEVFGQVPDEAACGWGDGWYYDDPNQPTKILLCPASCAKVQADEHPKVDVLVGCASVPAN